MRIVLIGGYPKGYKEAFHIKTKSGRVLRKIVDEVGVSAEYFDLWDSKEEEDRRSVSRNTRNKLSRYAKEKYVLIALGRYIEKELLNINCECEYLPHPASRDRKYLDRLKAGLYKFK